VTRGEYDAFMGLRDGIRNGIAGDCLPTEKAFMSTLRDALARGARLPYWAVFWTVLIAWVTP
jgi:hypothetical protein